MTRSEFDRQFAATQQNTEGYTDAQLAEINDRVFEQIADEDEPEKSYVDYLFEQAFAAADAASVEG